MGDVRWHNEETLPVDVRAAMRDVLAEGLREAARKEDPGDGYSTLLSAMKVIGEGRLPLQRVGRAVRLPAANAVHAARSAEYGMYKGGWMLQASHVEDVRMNPVPFVVVHAYSDSHVTKGSVSADVERTPADRRFLAEKKLADMVARRDRLNDKIDKLRSKLTESC